MEPSLLFTQRTKRTLWFFLIQLQNTSWLNLLFQYFQFTSLVISWPCLSVVYLFPDWYLLISVVDPDSMNPHPHPAAFPSESGSIVSLTKNRKKIGTVENVYIFFWSKIVIYLSQDILKRRSSYRRSFQPSKENIALQKMRFTNFFLFVWVIFTLLDSDPPHWLNIVFQSVF
jgi:hypothetical protein